MKLPINPVPLIKTYSHYAYVNSILDMKVLLDFSLYDKKYDYWEHHSGDLKEVSEGYRVTVLKGEKYLSKSSFRMEREANNKDSFVVQLFQITNLQRNAKLIFYISNRREVDTYDDMVYSMTIHQYAYTFDEYGANRKHSDASYISHPFIKASKFGKEVKFMFSQDGNSWMEQDAFALPVESDRLYWGIIAVNLDSCEYFEWMMQNFVNLSFDEKAEMTQVYLDYALYPSKNMQYENGWTDQFLDISYLPAGFLKIEEIIPWLKKMIGKGFYVAIALDEFFVQRRRNYHKKHHFHHSLFWGYEEDRKEFCIIGYDHAYEVSMIKEEEILNSGISKDANIIVYRENRNIIPFKFCVLSFAKSLSVFLLGKSPYEYLAGVFEIGNQSFGINVFESLQNTEKGIWVSCFDNRAAYLLMESATLWCVRIKYLEENNYVRNVKMIFDIANNLLNMCKKYLFFVQKNMVGACLYTVCNAEELWEKFEGKGIKEKAKEYIKKIENEVKKLVENVLKELVIDEC